MLRAIEAARELRAGSAKFFALRLISIQDKRDQISRLCRHHNTDYRTNGFPLHQTLLPNITPLPARFVPGRFNLAGIFRGEVEPPRIQLENIRP